MYKKIKYVKDVLSNCDPNLVLSTLANSLVHDLKGRKLIWL